MGTTFRAGHGLARERGLTLVEIMVALAIGALLLGLTVPTFASLRRAAGLSAATSELVSALHFARSTSILNGWPVTLCLSAGDGRCMESPREGARGWLVFSQPYQGSASQPGADRPPLQHFDLPADVSVHGTRAAVTFWPVTRAGTTSTFDLCEVLGASSASDHAQLGPRGRAVVVSQTGRPRVAQEEASCAP